MIETLTNKLEQTPDYQQTVMYDFYHKKVDEDDEDDEDEDEDDEDEDDEDEQKEQTEQEKIIFYEDAELHHLKNEIIEPILKNTLKIDTQIDRYEVSWSNGEDEEGDCDIIQYDFTYTLNEHKIYLTLDYYDDEKQIIHARVKIDDWLVYILKNYTEPLGYYENEEDEIKGIQLYNKDDATKFYKEFDSKEVYENEIDFFRELFTAFFICVFNETKIMYDEKICIPKTHFEDYFCKV